jgi:hypothetical protein
MAKLNCKVDGKEDDEVKKTSKELEENGCASIAAALKYIFGEPSG